MTEYVSILSCISVEDGQEAEQTDEVEELSEEERREVQETVEDLLSMQNPDILKRNLSHLVTENIRTKKKLKLVVHYPIIHQIRYHNNFSVFI